MNAEIVGSAAAALSTFTFAPQALRVIRTRDTAAISALTYGIVVISTVLWAAYGVLIGSRPVIVANAITFFLGGMILVLKLRQLGRDRRKS